MNKLKAAQCVPLFLFSSSSYFIYGQNRSGQPVCSSVLERTKKVEMLEQKLNALTEEDPSAQSLHSVQFGHYLVLSRAIEREKGYVRWLQKTLEIIDSFIV
ncbi:transcriptional regulator [Bacillus xiamenensis]|uniref:Transcription regulator PadR C-terminal domain-containing protein n=1 Tax=Bacillus xiamenensis TaxID=1178537 RepID=A0ABT4F7R8_9BACI|nr:transcriptional regulator [Bacillus xiamenensis]EKF33855.1 transcriptional regulator [Bacillus xiamenensis]MCY9576641.1 hypothetical protein [Bacillus xiamenensis]